MTDPATATCPVCRTPVPGDAPDGACPECMLRAALGATPGPAGAPRAPAMSVEEANRRFPQFEVLSLLGQGGMGVVWKARQRSLDRFVALKVLPQDVAAAPGFADRFRREARALARLDHPNIVHVYESGVSDGLCFLAMEFVDGTNLRQAMEAHAIRPREALAIVPQICDALQYAHDQGVVHRDVKPENVLLDRAGRVKIADFGIAKLVSADGAAHDRTLTGQVIGTPAYMAPEQYEHPAEVDHRADIYSLGVVFYEMLTGELPLGRFAAPSRKVQMDVRLDEIVLRTLEKEREARYQRAAEVRTDVDAVVAGRASSPATGAVAWHPEETRRWTARARALAAACAGFARRLPTRPGVCAFLGALAVWACTATVSDRMRGWPVELLDLRFSLTFWSQITVATGSLVVYAVLLVRRAPRSERALALAAAALGATLLTIATWSLPEKEARARVIERAMREVGQAEEVRRRDEAAAQARFHLLQSVHGAADFERLAEFYAPEDRATLAAMPADERARRGAAGEFGLPLASRDRIGRPLAETYLAILPSSGGRPARFFVEPLDERASWPIENPRAIEIHLAFRGDGVFFTMQPLPAAPR